jgi:AcrR family transcriptional regulator
VPAALSEAEKEARRGALAAAARLFVEQGDALTMRRLAAELGYSTMAIYRWFKNKEEMLIAVRTYGFNQFAQALESALAKPGSARERSQSVDAAYVRFARENPNFYRVLFERPPESDPEPELSRAMARMTAAMAAHIDLMLEDASIVADAKMLRLQMWASIHGAVMLDYADLLKFSVLKLQRSTVDALVTAAQASPRTRRNRSLKRASRR